MTLAPLVSLLTRGFAAVRVAGAEHLPRHGPAVVAANHISHLDTLLLFSVIHRLGRRPRFLATEGLWEQWWTGWLFDRGRFIPVRRGRPPEEMVADALAALAAGEVVVVYPEGTIVPPGERRHGRPGAGLLAARAPAPVIPVAMAGVPPWTGRPPVRARCGVVFGPPVTVPAVPDPPTRETMVAASDALLDAIRRLLPLAEALAARR